MKPVYLLLSCAVAALGGGLAWKFKNREPAPSKDQSAEVQVAKPKPKPRPPAPVSANRTDPRWLAALPVPVPPADAPGTAKEPGSAQASQLLVPEQALPVEAPVPPAVVQVPSVIEPSALPAPPDQAPVAQPEPEPTDADYFAEASAVLDNDPLAAAQIASRMSRGPERTQLVSEAFHRMGTANFREALHIAGQTEDAELGMAAAASAFLGGMESRQVIGDRAALAKLMVIARSGVEFAAASSESRAPLPAYTAAAQQVFILGAAAKATELRIPGATEEAAAIAWMARTTGDNGGRILRDLIAVDRANAAAGIQ